jgi:hypothetical protein
MGFKIMSKIGPTSASSTAYNYSYYDNGPEDEDIAGFHRSSIARTSDPTVIDEGEINENEVENGSTSETDPDSLDMDIEIQPEQAQKLLEKISPEKLPLGGCVERVATTSQDAWRKLAVKRNLFPAAERKYEKEAAEDVKKSEAATLKAHSAMDEYYQTGDENALERAENNIVRAQAYNLRKKIYSSQEENAKACTADAQGALKMKQKALEENQRKLQEHNSRALAGLPMTHAAIEQVCRGKNIFSPTGLFPSNQ